MTPRRKGKAAMLYVRRRHMNIHGEKAGLKAVLFDLGGTLVKTASPPEIIRRILEKYGFNRRIEDIAVAHQKAEESMSPEDYRLPYYEFWIKWNKRILKALQISEKADFLAKVLVDEWWDNANVELYSDVEETLEKLRRMGLKLGIITNAFKKDIDEIFARANLPNFFDVAVGIDTIGKPKPDPQVFLYAVRELNIKPHESLFIGDSLENDYFGAVKAGLKAVLIDRASAINDRPGLIKISDLRELIKLVRSNI